MLYFIIAFILLSALLFYPLEVQTYYRRKAEDDLLLIKIVIIPNVWIHRIEIPIIALEKGKIPSFKVKTELESPGNDTMLEGKAKYDISWDNIWHVIKNIQPYYKLISCYFKSGKILFRPWVLKSFYWNTSFGTGDAALTGLATGAIWSMKTLFWRQMTHVMNVNENPKFKVFPDFFNKKLEVEIDGIFACRLGNIIIAVIKAWLNLRTFYKGGDKK